MHGQGEASDRRAHRIFPISWVIYLGTQAKSLQGLWHLRFVHEDPASVEAEPDGLVFHQLFLLGPLPLHLRFRQ